MTRKPFTQTALACFLTGLITAIVSNRIGLRYFHWLLSPNNINVLSILLLIAMLIYIFIWLHKAIRKQDAPSMLTAFWQNALRYILSLDMVVFGVCKFFRVQFNTPLALLDNPFNTLPDSDLMWAFFGHSYPFTLVIATLEITGALMLLFRKTRLLAVIFLLPICLNIFALDIFYNGVVTSVYIGIEIAGYIYLLLIERERLYKFFFVDQDDSPHFTFKSQALRNAVKLSVVIIPAILMLLKGQVQFYPEINGKYEVKALVVGSIRQKLPGIDSILTKVYIDKNDIVLEYNHYNRRFIGSYKYNQNTKEIEAWWRYPGNHPENLFGKIIPGKDPDQKTLIGHMGKETFKIDLQRVNKGI
jgi:ABC-type multidrug transport system fused ATPase/permease subunit